MKTWLTENFNIKYPIIMAPMFLVTNAAMLESATSSGIMGCIPALNWKSPEEFKQGIVKLLETCNGPFGVNLIVNRSNIHLEKQLKILENNPVAFVITSLGSPRDAIKRLQPKGTKIFCDVVDADHANKVEALGADALIAVNSGAGGHAGKIPASILVPMLKKSCTLPVIAAGGVNSGSGILSMLALGAEGLSIGSPFISSTESSIDNAYKQAIVDYSAKDIVMTDKISGTPCTVIQTPYVEKLGLHQNMIEKFLNTNKHIKKYAKMLTYHKGMKLLEKAAFGASYKTVWCAGPSIEFSDSIEPVQNIVDRLVSQYESSLKEFEAKK